MTAGETHQAIEAIFRIERARLIAGLARVVRNVDLAEEGCWGATEQKTGKSSTQSGRSGLCTLVSAF
ncbi:MAG: hypothetical protein WB696_09255 [Chthoniobacterales bacterium]|jgi:hypothetical protein